MLVGGVVPTVRPELLRAFLASWRGHPAVAGVQLHAFCQREPQAAFDAVREEFSDLNVVWYYRAFGGPVWPIRCAVMLGAPDVDVWINFDDDMELLPGMTDYYPAVARALEPDVGVVSCNWVRSEAPGFMKKAWPPGDALWVKQPLVNMAGGQVYARKVVREMAPYRDVPYLFDDIQAGLVAYLAGYENFRFRGSLIIHRILAPGGLKIAFNEVTHHPPDKRHVRTRRCKPVFAADENNLYMPTSNDLTPFAKQVHDQARRLLLARLSESAK